MSKQDYNVETTPKSEEIKKPIVQFLQENRLTYNDGDILHTMTCTKTEADKKYFSCVNRHLEPSNPKKCNATAIYKTSNGFFTIKKPHSLHCGKNQEIQCKVDGSYDIQKQIILEELTTNPRLNSSRRFENFNKE